MNHAAYHKPVLLQEAIRYLVHEPDGMYLDATLGGGGHSAHILDHLSEKGHLYAIDQDEDAIRHCRKRFNEETRITVIKGNFGYMDILLPKEVDGELDGVLFDLGVSSHQLDEPRRGFSFRSDGPLDMRMGDLQMQKASDVINNCEYDALRDLVYRYGEERMGSRIARAIVQARPVETTLELRDAIASVVPSRHLNKSLARVFQAVRIHVNDELTMLRQAVEKGTGMLNTEGRIVAITYHSLEDRICKNYFRHGNFEGKPVRDFYGNPVRPLKPLFSKIVVPSESEMADNPRARSARLRVAVRLEDQPGGFSPENRGYSLRAGGASC